MCSYVVCISLFQSIVEMKDKVNIAKVNQKKQMIASNLNVNYLKKKKKETEKLHFMLKLESKVKM